MPSVEGAGVELHYEISGEGAPVLLIHGLAADGAVWDEVVAELAGELCTLVYDRRGYGASGAPEPYERTTVEEQAQDAAALLGALGLGPALICGDGFGALIALDLLKRHRALVCGAVFSNTPLFAFVPAATEVLSAQRERLASQLRKASPQAAVAEWLQDRVDGAALARAQIAHRAFFADFAGISSWPVGRAELRGLDVPAVVLTGPHTPPHLIAAADALAALLPDVHRRRDGHFVAALRAVAR